MRNKFGGYILLEVLIAVQVIVLIVLFVTSITVYHRSVVLENRHRQSAMYTLQTEFERFVSEKTIDGFRDDGSGALEERVYKVSDDMGYTYDIRLYWDQASDNSPLFFATGQVEWGTADKKRSITYTTGNFLERSSVALPYGKETPDNEAMDRKGIN